jgi:diketogulonate reductase-like aldo/keto reductase
MQHIHSLCCVCEHNSIQQHSPTANTLGVNFYDTAYIYLGSEAAVGEIQLVGASSASGMA